MNSPLRISVVTPSFDQAQFLDATMQSVLGQSYTNLEYVVMDGGSTDGSVDLIQQRSPQLHYWTSEPDDGPGDAINKGFARTTGEVMAWLNSDDLYQPWTFAVVDEIFRSFPRVDWITEIPAFWDSRGGSPELDRDYPRTKLDFLTGHYRWIQQESSTFWRRSLWDRAGGRLNTPQTKIAVDTELWTRFFDLAELYHVECIIGGFRFWGGNRSLLKANEMQSEIDLCLSDMKNRQDETTTQIASRMKSYRSSRLPGSASLGGDSPGGYGPTPAFAKLPPTIASSAMTTGGSSRCSSLISDKILQPVAECLPQTSIRSTASCQEQIRATCSAPRRRTL